VQGDGLGSHHHLTKQVVQGDDELGSNYHLIKANMKPNKSLIALVGTLRIK
jgi:hypothetical protein